MNRLERVERLKEVYEDISGLENTLRCMDSSYYKNAELTIEVSSEDFKENENNTFTFGENNKHLLTFIKMQIASLKDESKEILKELSNEY